MIQKSRICNFVKPEKTPFFYGFVIMLVGTLGIWASVPGQTIGISTFTDPVKDALGLNRDQISFAYMLGTLLSSFFLAMAGRWYDKYGARKLGFYASLGLASTLVVSSQSDDISNFIKSILGTESFLVSFFVILILFLLIRFSGQGVLTMVSRNMVMKWFDQYRGRVNAFCSVAVSLGFSISPLWISLLIDFKGWQGAWLLMAAGLLVTSVFIIVFFRDNPERFGLLPDGKLSKQNSSKDETPAYKQFTLVEAKSTRAFWMYSLTLSFYSFFVTGLTFHVISIFGNSGYTKDQAVSIFMPIAIVSVLISLSANIISDWIKLQILLYIGPLGSILAAVGLVYLEYNWGRYLIISGAGIMGGIFAVLSSVTWPRFYGRKHLGAISGKIMSMFVFASALGPFVFSYSKTLFSTYSAMGLISVIFIIVLSIASIKATKPEN